MSPEATAPSVPVNGPVEAPTILLAVDERVEARIRTLLEREIERWSEVDPSLREPVVALRDLVDAGGKRLRPAFCHWAYRGAGGSPAAGMIAVVGAPLEAVPVDGLLDDGRMDRRGRRRGLPSARPAVLARDAGDGSRGEERRCRGGVASPGRSVAFFEVDQL